MLYRFRSLRLNSDADAASAAPASPEPLIADVTHLLTRSRIVPDDECVNK